MRREILIPNPESGPLFLERARTDIVAWLAHHGCPAPEENFWSQPMGMYKPRPGIWVMATNIGTATQYRTAISENGEFPVFTTFESNFRHILYNVSPSFQKPDPFFDARCPTGFIYTHTPGIIDCLGGEAFERIWLQAILPLEFRIDRTTVPALVSRGHAMLDKLHVQYLFTDPERYEYYATMEREGNYEGRMELGAIPMQGEEGEKEGLTWEFPEFTMEIPEGVVTWI